MNNRLANRKQETAKKRLLIAVLALAVLMLAGIGSYFLLQPEPETALSTEVKKDSFAGKSYAGFNVEEKEIVEEPPATEEGTVEDAREEEPAEPEPQPEVIIESSSTPVAAPEKDLSTMIANAKTQVYTIYTDLEQGSGFLYNELGDVVTNAHVVKDAAYITLKNSDGQEFNGQVIGISDTEDLALVRVAELAGKKPMAIETKASEKGRKVVAIGSPQDQSNTATEGEITAVNKSFSADYEYTGLYEMTAAIQKGSSGGPLIDAETERIIGINSIILEDSPGIGYAIPLYSVTEQLNAWAADPIVYEEEEVVLQDVKDAYFDEQLLTSFIESYYELIPYALNEPAENYYQQYLLPGSEAEAAGKAMVESYRTEDRIFNALKPIIDGVEIGDKEAKVTATAELVYKDKASGKTLSEMQTAAYTIVIDEFGDYQIKTITMSE
jgi:S1-C subfamily serine protease